MKIKHAKKKQSKMIRNIVIAVVTLVGIFAILMGHITQILAIDDPTVPTYSFSQKIRVFENDKWNDAVLNTDGSVYYYPAGSPAVVEFELTLSQNKQGDDYFDIIIQNSLPEGMEYIDGSQKIGINGISVNENQIPTAASHNFQVKHDRQPFAGGFPNIPPQIMAGSTITVTFRARFLFDRGSCQTVTNHASIDITDVASRTIIADFESPCTGLPAPTPSPKPIYVIEPLPPTPAPSPSGKDKDSSIKTPITGAKRRW